MHIHADEMCVEDIFDNILYISNSMDEGSYENNLVLAGKCSRVIPCFGIHPWRAAENQLSSGDVEKLIRKNLFVGEIGIDQFWIEDSSTYTIQFEVFEMQLRLSAKYNCIPSIHTKGAEAEILDLIRKYKISKSIIHWYSGPSELIKDYLDEGCYFTIGPDIITGSEVWSRIPLNRLFVETDNPTGIPWILGGKASGGDIILVYRKLAENLGMEEKELCDRVKENLRELVVG